MADAERFLRIVSRQADRLNAIIDDLLSLAKIEREGETEDIALALAPLREVLATAMHDCEPTAAARDVRIALECPEDLRARINAPLLRQAVANLLDNAIKYSEASSEVRIEAGRQGNDTFIRVRDQGCGVAEEHLPRLFERFYRADKARSRKLGGTGLGLAIVRRIVTDHDGQIHAGNHQPKGALFTFELPV